MRKIAPALAVCLYCALAALPLFQAWLNSPFEKLSWIAFFIWLFPLTIVHAKTPSPWFLGAALAATLLGTLGELNTLKYIGLSLSIASFAPWGWGLPIWLLAAVAWMPVFGWLSAHFFPALAIPLKLGSVFLASTLLALQKGEIG